MSETLNWVLKGVPIVGREFIAVTREVKIGNEIVKGNYQIGIIKSDNGKHVYHAAELDGRVSYDVMDFTKGIEKWAYLN